MNSHVKALLPLTLFQTKTSQGADFHIADPPLPKPSIHFCLQVIPIIDIPGLGDRAAETVCKELGIKSQHDAKKLEEAKHRVYLKGFDLGVLTVGPHAGKKVRGGRPKAGRCSCALLPSTGCGCYGCYCRRPADVAACVYAVCAASPHMARCKVCVF